MKKNLVQLNLRIPQIIKEKLRRLARGQTMTAKLIELIKREVV